MVWNACVATLALAALLVLACGASDAPAPTPTATATSTPTTMPAATATPTPTTTPTPTASPTVAPMPTPTATPTPAPSPSATPTPTPTATPTATPTPAPLADLVEPAPDAFEHRAFEPGEEIDWSHGIFFMDTETGGIDGYRLMADIGDYGDYPWDNYHATDDDTWISGTDGNTVWVMNRHSQRAWRLPGRLRTVAMSNQRMLLEDRHQLGMYQVLAYSTLTQDGGDMTPFSIGPQQYGGSMALFAPSGKMIALVNELSLYLLELDPISISVLFDGKMDRDNVYHVGLTHLGERGFLITAHISSGLERYAFSWDGKELPWDQRWERLSPDGRYGVWEEYGHSIANQYCLYRAWPSIVLADTATGEPVLRIRSAWGDPRGVHWLPSGDGFLIRMRDRSTDAERHAIVWVRPEPRIVWLPDPPGDAFWGWVIPAPTGADRQFAWYAPYRGVQLYDALDRSWGSPVASERTAIMPPSWGEDHRELRFALWPPLAKWGVCDIPFLAPPKIEAPPFDERFAFRVARGESCLPLRAEPDAEGRVLDCLPTGTRLLLSASREWAEAAVHDRDPSIAWSDGYWIYVHTDDGAEGWVAHEYLDHD